MTAPIGVVFNPNSKKNLRDPARFDRLQQLLGDDGVVWRTRHVDDIAAVVHDMLDNEVPYWVADGGDGAFHWLVNVADQVVRERGKGESIPAIMPTNSGTIDFMGRKAGVVGDAESLLTELVRLTRRGEAPERVPIDSLRLRGVHGDWSERPGAPFERVGFATALAGIGQGFFDKFYANGRLNGVGVLETVGRILASASTRARPVAFLPLPTSLRCYADSVFEQAHLHIEIDGKPVPLKHFRVVNAGSIDINLADLFRLFPMAAAPGVIHVQVGDPDLLDVVRQLPRLMAGKAMNFEGLIECPATEMSLAVRGQGSIDPVIDGELFYGLKALSVTPGPAIEVLRVVGQR